MKYRIIVGEQGNEQGHIINQGYVIKTVAGDRWARAVLRQALKPFGHDGWGRIEINDDPEVAPHLWRRMEETI